MNDSALLIPLAEGETVTIFYSIYAPPELWDSFLFLICYE